jgi:hypothetical protein
MAINPWSTEHPVPPEKFAAGIDQIADFDRFPADTKKTGNMPDHEIFFK